MTQLCEFIENEMKERDMAAYVNACAFDTWGIEELQANDYCVCISINEYGRLYFKSDKDLTSYEFYGFEPDEYCDTLYGDDINFFYYLKTHLIKNNNGNLAFC